MAAILGLMILLWALEKTAGVGRGASGRIAMALPLVGPILRRNLVARWCDALELGVDAGLDLPAAIDLAAQAVQSPALVADGRRLSDALSAGQPLSTIGKPRLLPATVPAAMQLGANNGNLPETLRTLSDMYQRQAELRMAALPSILTPLLTIGIASIIGLVIVALFMPLITLIQTISGG
jgi:type II secretory pathway component PulF